MTLIETMIVLAIGGLMIGMVLFSITSGRAAELTRVTNQLANSIRFAFNKARVDGAYYRMNINLEQRTFSLQRADDRMYMPARDRYGQIVVISESDKRDQEDRDKRAEESYNSSVQSHLLQAEGGAAETDGDPLDPYASGPLKVPRRKPPIFAAFDDDDNSLSTLGEPFKFPEELEIVSVRTGDDAKPITTGEANLYFFPQGRTQAAHIQLRRKLAPDTNEEAFTVIVHPLTGRVEIKEGLVDLKLPNDPRDSVDDKGRKQSRRTF